MFFISLVEPRSLKGLIYDVFLSNILIFTRPPALCDNRPILFKLKFPIKNEQLST